MQPLYLSVEDFKLFIRDTSTTNDKAYGMVLAAVEQAIETYVGRGPLKYATTTEYYSPSGQREIWLERFPLRDIADITAVYEDWNGNFGQTSGGFDATASILTLGTDYSVAIEGTTNRAVLRRIGTVWPYQRESPVGYLSSLRGVCPGSVKVTYAAGFTSQAPADVIVAAYTEAAARWKKAPFGWGFPSAEAVAGASASISLIQSKLLEGSPFITEDLLKAARPYRMIPCGVA